MMDPEPRQNKSWPDLAERAAQAAAPEIDVAASVLAALLSAPASTTLADEMAAWFARPWFKPSFAALLLAAGGLAYGGYRSSDALSFLFEFTL